MIGSSIGFSVYDMASFIPTWNNRFMTKTAAFQLPSWNYFISSPDFFFNCMVENSSSNDRPKVYVTKLYILMLIVKRVSQILIISAHRNIMQ